jgi:hypothetical protein
MVLALPSGESALSESPAATTEFGKGFARERSMFEFGSTKTGADVSPSDPGTLEERFERERLMVRGGYTNDPCFAVISSPGGSSVKALLFTIRSLAGEDDIDGGRELGGLGVFGLDGRWKLGKRKGSCWGVESSSKRRRKDEGRVDA